MPDDRKPPYFPFFPRDFVADPVVAAMTPEECGGYILLLCFAWMDGQTGTLPDDEQTLARLSRLGDRWPECREAIRSAFHVSKGRLLQKRMVQEAKALSVLISRKSEQGRLGAYARWAKKLDASAMPGQWRDDSTQTQIQIKDSSIASQCAVEPETVKNPDTPSEASQQQTVKNPDTTDRPEIDQPALANPQPDTHSLVAGLASRLELPAGRESPPCSPKELAEAVAAAGKAGQVGDLALRNAIGLTTRLLKAGTIRRLEQAVTVARHWWQHSAGIREPFAYYSPGGPGAHFALQRAQTAAQAAEHAAIRAEEDREWPKRGP
jgi:uncharacterized protein YdaU (DUF1376 family)